LADNAEILSSQTITYTINVTHTSEAGSANTDNISIADLIPLNTIYQPGSLKLFNGTTTISLTDADDGDAGQYDSVNNQVLFDVGTLTSSDNIRQLSFDVQVLGASNLNQAPDVSTVISNQATYTYTTNTPNSGSTDTLPLTVGSSPDI